MRGITQLMYPIPFYRIVALFACAFLPVRASKELKPEKGWPPTTSSASIGSPEKGGGPNLIHMLDGTLEVQGR